MERHYLNFTVDDLAGGIVGGRNIMSIEGILWTYGNGGYYNYASHLYNAGLTTGVSIHNAECTMHNEAGACYDLQGRKLAGKPTQKGVYINKGRKLIRNW